MPLRKRSLRETAQEKADVGLWPKADMRQCTAHVRFRGQSGHGADVSECALWGSEIGRQLDLARAHTGRVSRLVREVGGQNTVRPFSSGIPRSLVSLDGNTSQLGQRPFTRAVA